MLWRSRRAAPVPVAPAAWEIATGRLRRAVRRYHDKVAVMPDRRLRLELREFGAGLTAAVEQIAAAEAADAAITQDAVARRAITRAATLCAHATEAAMMANDASWHGELRDLTRCLDAVSTLAKAVRELTDRCCPRF